MTDPDTILCSRCCGQSPATQRFCGDCGAALEAEGVFAPVDEIRVATVMFADVADFTATSARLGLEAVKSLMDRVFERLYQVIVRHGGVVDKYIGDCVMALFGAPIAHGDDAARAVRAGLEMQRSLKEMRLELEAGGLPAVQMRVGINTGPLIAGMVGAGPQRRYTVMGHTVNVAAHLQRDVPRGTVAIAEGTIGRVRGLFDVRPVVGVNPPAYAVGAHRFGGHWLRPRELLGAEIPLVGRKPQLARLAELVETGQTDSRSRLVMVKGEAGVGKTRLGSELLSRLEQGSNAVRITAFADPLSAGAPLAVAADALRRKLEIAADQPADEALERLTHVLRQLGCQLREGDEAVLERMLGLQRRDGDSHAAEDLEPADFARRSTQLFADVLDRLTRLAPLVIVVDDLQWCDPASLELLQGLLLRLPDRPLTIVGLARPEFFRDHATVLEAIEHEVIALPPLSATEVGALLDRAVGTPARRRLLKLVASALGNPQHVEELLRTLEDRGALVREVDGWRLGDVPEDLELPPGVEAVAQVRIDALSPTQRTLLRLAALVGGTFWEGALRELAGEVSAHDLSTLVRREIVVRMPRSRFGNQREYRFLHGVTRDVAYRMLPDSQRAELHRRVADWLRRQGPTAAEDLALVAMHLERGGDRAGAAEQLKLAGDAAYDAAAYRMALAHFDRAAELAVEGDQVFALLGRRERVYNALGCWSEQRTDAARLLELSPDRDEQRMEALLRHGRALLNLGEHQRARADFDEALALARELGVAEGAARALRWLGMYHFNRSEHRDALPLFTEALQVAEGAGEQRLAAELAYELGVTVGTVGDYVQALEVSRRALSMFRAQGNRYQEAFCLGNIGCFHIYLGEHDEAIVALEQSAALGLEMGIPLAQASAEANLGNACRQVGQLERAMALEEQAQVVARRIGDVRLDADSCLYGGLTAIALGRGEHARALIERALDLSRGADMDSTEAVALMARARLELSEERPVAAATSASQAVAILERMGSIEGFEAEIRLTHVRACLAAGEDARALETLTRAHQDVLERAGAIPAGERRRRFVTAVPSNAELGELAERLLAQHPS